MRSGAWGPGVWPQRAQAEWAAVPAAGTSVGGGDKRGRRGEARAGFPPCGAHPRSIGPCGGVSGKAP